MIRRYPSQYSSQLLSSENQESGAKIMSSKYCASSTPFEEVYLQDGQIYLKQTGTNSSWKAMDNEPVGLVDIVSYKTAIYGLDNKGKVLSYKGNGSTTPQWSEIIDLNNHDIVSITCDSTGHIYPVDNQGDIYRSKASGDAWQLYDHLPILNWKYTVKKGDSLWVIAQHEYHTTDNVRTQQIVEQIKKLNIGLVTNWDYIVPGMVLNMPPR
jgi:LysM repeat protein